jgi:hypothetical protein
MTRTATLNRHGSAVLPQLLNAQECEAVAGLYADARHFRSRVVMQRHGFGQGEYQYFSYPLPDVVARLRATLYPRLVDVANAWNEAMGIDVRYPPTMPISSRAATRPASNGPRRCSCNTGPATTTACTRTCMASTCSRSRSRCCCRARAKISAAANLC